MLAELYLPDLFGQLLSWLSGGVLPEKIAEVEGGTGEHSAGVRTWGELQPKLPAEKLAEYLLFAASLRGETIEEAALPAELRELAGNLISGSQATRNQARTDALRLDGPKQVAIIQYLAAALRQQGEPATQKVHAEAISALAAADGAAATAVEEIARMRHGMITAALPIGLQVHTRPPEFRTLIETWQASPDVSDTARNACGEALGLSS
jgi:hypothetical protein